MTKLLSFIFVLNFSLYATDLLPSWNKGTSREAIINYVTTVTEESSEDFIPKKDRIAVFDNDGTLWSEQPAYFQLFFAIDRVKELASKHPEWKTEEPFKSVLANDMKGVIKSGKEGLLKLILATHTGMSDEEFDKIVTDWINTAKHPRFNRLYKELVPLKSTNH